MKLSVVIPVYNEEDNIELLLEAVENALPDIDHEVVLVDDGSTDSTVEKILKYGKANVRLLVFARNFGQTSAMAAGIEAAEGDYIAMLDGDLQNDPTDIPLMLAKLEEDGLDMVAGRRANRQDGMFLRKIPSLCANKLIRKISNVEVRDHGCTLKVFKSDLAKELDLYGELHRFIPILANIRGAKIVEMDVKHHPRKFGQSKYGLERVLKVASDLLLMWFLTRFRQRPMHFFGVLGFTLFIAGAAIEAYLLVEKLMGNDIGTRPLFYLGIFLLLTSVQLFTTGFLADILMRTHFRASNKKPYTVAVRYKDGERV